MIKTPIRYPGGKSRHTDSILRYLDGHEEEYREPFFGGGSIFFSIPRIHIEWINDLDYGVYDLWKTIQDDPQLLIRFIKLHTDVLDHKKNPRKIKKAINLWKKIKQDKSHKLFPAGYRTLFLNKTCFNGIQTGGPTGGIHQTGEYTLLSRWSANSTISRINIVHNRLKGVKITNLSWQKVIEDKSNSVFMYLDPPYLKKGKQIYEYYFTIKDHEELADRVLESKHRFVVSVDDCEEIRKIWIDRGHPEKCLISETWLYSMSDYRNKNRQGKELFIVDKHSLEISQSKKNKYLEEFE